MSQSAAGSRPRRGGAAEHRAQPWGPLLALLLAVALMAVAAYFVYAKQFEIHRREAASRVEAGAALDAAHVSDWFETQIAIASDVIGSPFTSLAVMNWIERPTPQLGQQLDDRLAAYRDSYGFSAVGLYDTSAQLLKISGPTAGPEQEIRDAVVQALSTGKVALTPPRTRPGQPALVIDFVAPLMIGTGSARRPVGAIAMSTDTTELLDSLGHAFAADDVGQVILAWRNGDAVEFAVVDPAVDGEPRLGRFEEPQRGSWQEWALAGHHAAVETAGPDGRAIIAAAEPAPRTPAAVVVAQDLASIRAHTLTLVGEVASLAFVGLAVAVALALLWWRAEKRRADAELRRTTERAAEVEARLNWLSRDANDIILLIGLDDRILDANERAVAAYGRGIEELVGLPALTLRSQDTECVAAWPAQRAAIVREGSLIYETRHRRRDGSTFPVEISARIVSHAGRSFVQSIVRDITERKEQQSRIERSEAAYRALFQANPHPMWAYDVDTLRFLAVNDAAVAQYGYSQAEFLTMTIADIRPSEELPRLKANLAATGHADLQDSGVWVHRTRSGALIDVEIVSHSMDFADRRARVVLAHDVTKRVQAERLQRASEERYRRLFDQASDGVLQLRPDGTLLDANAEAQHMFGYNRAELRAAGIAQLLAEKERGRFERLSKALLGNSRLPPAFEQWRLVRKDGSRFTAEIRARVLSDGTLIATVRDLTEVIAAQQRLAEQRDLREAKDRAESADRAKTAFLRSVSHELRSPLHSIIGFTAALLEGLGGELNPAQREQMQIVNDSARHLLDIINDLLDVSRIEAGAVAIEARSYRPADLLRRIVQRFSLQAAAKGLEFRLECVAGEIAVVGDERRVEQVVSNLVSNAIKFTERGSVTVRLVAGDERLRFEVADTGKGIATEDQPRLFNYFTQLDPGPHNLTQGTGLGLAIAMGLAEAMEGAIEVRSQPGQGSRFALVLPLHVEVAA